MLETLPARSMAIQCAFYVVVHMVVRNMDHKLAAVLGQDSNFDLHKVDIVMAAQPA